jgi:hypothetical protein
VGHISHLVKTLARYHLMLPVILHKSCEDNVAGGGRGAFGLTRYLWFVYSLEVSQPPLGASSCTASLQRGISLILHVPQSALEAVYTMDTLYETAG